MKDKISIAIALVSILISCCLVPLGCTPPFPGYITLDSLSEVMQPKFYMYYHQERLDIGTIIVWKVLHSSEVKKRWDFNSGHVYLPLWYHPRAVESEMVWYLQYEPSDNFINRLLGRRSTSPVPSLTYGEVPPGYQEKVKALPLEPERFYIVQMRGGGRPSEGMTFTILLDDSGIPQRLEYHLKNFLITHPSYPTNPRDDLKLW